ncbi:MAG: protein kinase [Thermoanaerobaculia bacterium]|jgi:serine/threonine-protein kinase
MIGRTVGHYLVLAHLGGGGMGVVYKGEDLTLGRFVALKFLPPELTRDDDARKRFLREARAASQLDHPNICTVHEIGETDGQTWIAMGFYDGETLKARLEKGVMDEIEAVVVAIQIARGLGKAHASGIVHRDIKPANVMLTRDGAAKIVDFGLAKLSGASHITQTKQTLGTLAYMAPEQLLGEAVGPQADLWSLGATLFEMLTGARAFRGESAQAMAYAILNEQPQSVTALRPGAAPALDRIVKKLLRKDPLQRYQASEEVIGDLAALVPSHDSGGKAAPRPASDREMLRSGARLGPYEIVEPLGSGGMGDVYRARDTRLDRQVAVKVLAPEFSEDAERRQRFQREARTISSLSHANICTLFDVGEQEGTDYLVMEFLEGETLAERLARGPPGLSELLKIGAEIAEALGRAHQQGVIHRDLKPANVILTASGVAKLVDFGLAKGIAAVLEESDSGSGRRRSSKPVSREDSTAIMNTPGSPSKPLTAEGAIVGTLPYMAPEQVEGREADARSDIFSLGAILYEMATGRRAFEGATKASLVAAILTSEPAMLADLNEGSSSNSASRRTLAPVEHVVRRCLDKEPERRWQNALDVANELKWIGEQGSPTAPASQRAAARRANRVIASLCGLVLVLGGSVGWLGWRQLHPAKAPSRPNPRITQLTWGKGRGGGAAISPDGTTFVYMSDVSGNDDIHFRRIGGEKAINLTEDCKKRDHLPSFSPDGQFVVYRSECDGGGLFVVGATGESKRRLTDFGNIPDWSPDGRSITFTEADSVWVVDSAGGTPKKIIEKGSGYGTWSPTGTRLAIYVDRPGERIAIATIPAEGGTPTIVYELSGTHYAPLEWTRGWIWFSSLESGSLWLWRVPVDDVTGARIGDAEPVTIGSADARKPSATADGRRLLFTSGVTRTALERWEFDPVRGRVAGGPHAVMNGPNVEFKVLSPDGRQLAIILWDNDNQNIGLVQLSTGDWQRLTDGAPQKGSFAWAPDGSKIYFDMERSPTEVWSVRPDGSHPQREATTGGSANLNGRAVSPDGRWLLAVAADRRGLSMIDLSLPLERRTLVPLPLLPDGRSASIDVDYFDAVSPDGEQLLVRAARPPGPSGADTWIFHVGARSYRKLAMPPRVEWAGWLPDSRRLLLLREHALSVFDTQSGALTDAGSFDSKSEYPTLSRDGCMLFTQRSEFDSDVYMLDFGTKK